MEDLLKFCLTNGIFKPEYVMNLFYGSLCYRSRKTVATQDYEIFCSWDINCISEKDWSYIPLEKRMEIITLTIKRSVERYVRNANCFHDRILCLMHELLNDDENRVECLSYPMYGGKLGTAKYRRYSTFIYPEMRQSAVTEMFLWWHMGVRKSNEERRLLKECWIKFLGFNRPLSQKTTSVVVAQTIEELESELTETRRIINVNEALIRKRYVREKKEIRKRHLTKPKKEFLLAQMEAKDNAARNRLIKAQNTQAKCLTALAFLKGYSDFISASAKLKH